MNFDYYSARPTQRPKGFKHGDHPIGLSGRSTRRLRKAAGPTVTTEPKTWWEVLVNGKGRKVGAPKRGWSRTYA